MKFEKGTSRFVIIFPCLGIAIKLPIIRLLIIRKLLVTTIRFGFKRVWIDINTPLDNPIGFGYKILGGILNNWREFLFYYRTRSPFLQPTYFSFFGLINIQKAGKHCFLERKSLYAQFCELTDDGVHADRHHFSSPSNFCFSDGKVRILDYGSKTTQLIVAKYGAEMFGLFDPTYNWKKVKKSRINQ